MKQFFTNLRPTATSLVSNDLYFTALSFEIFLFFEGYKTKVISSLDIV